jgi:hypothetical protein
MMLTNLPPEIIVMIYDSLDIKSKAKLSMVNSYIYDCRPIDEINHRKHMTPVIKSINSMIYVIVEWGRSEYDRETHRFICKMESMYRYNRFMQSIDCFKQENFWAKYHYEYNLYSKFRYGSFTLGKKVRHTVVDIQKSNGNVYMCLY